MDVSHQKQKTKNKKQKTNTKTKQNSHSYIYTCCEREAVVTDDGGKSAKRERGVRFGSVRFGSVRFGSVHLCVLETRESKKERRKETRTLRILLCH